MGWRMTTPLDRRRKFLAACQSVRRSDSDSNRIGALDEDKHEVGIKVGCPYHASLPLGSVLEDDDRFLDGFVDLGGERPHPRSMPSSPRHSQHASRREVRSPMPSATNRSEDVHFDKLADTAGSKFPLNSRGREPSVQNRQPWFNPWKGRRIHSPGTRWTHCAYVGVAAGGSDDSSIVLRRG